MLVFIWMVITLIVWTCISITKPIFFSNALTIFACDLIRTAVTWKKISLKLKELYYIASEICKHVFQQPFIVPQINSAVRGAHYLETRENVFRLKLDKTTFYIITMHHHPVLFWSTWFWPKTLSRPVHTSVYDVTSLIYFLFWSFFSLNVAIKIERKGREFELLTNSKSCSQLIQIFQSHWHGKKVFF